eukprot:809082-Pleurochrysis_carterae.AAC.3
MRCRLHARSPLPIRVLVDNVPRLLVALGQVDVQHSSVADGGDRRGGRVGGGEPAAARVVAEHKE